MLDDAFAHAEGEVQAAKGRIALLKPGDDAQRMQVVVEAQAVGAQGAVEGFFARVAKRRMADVMRQRQSFCQLRIQPESVRQRCARSASLPACE